MMGWEGAWDGARWFGRVHAGGIRRTGDGAGRDGRVLVGYNYNHDGMGGCLGTVCSHCGVGMV